MDFVITEAGIYEVSAAGLRIEDDLAVVAARAALLRDARRPMAQAELATLLNTLLEAERAGAKVVAAFLTELSLDPAAQASLVAIQRDESHNCANLIGLLRHIGATPSRATGNFLAMALAIQGDRERLAFLNRGQAWVARRIAAALPRIADPRVRAEMQAMYDSHVANIGVCEKVLDEELAQ
jgi:nitronate monooxygenase